ncbi:hypothetical protein [Pedobacter sp. KACC 23697]|uniref:Uncharacterized protein n=1 Tax=Pedobacter sp. KACC 23697 TaxID=3149230 RepID=A0AAU7K6L8_9SPHI
MTNQLINFYEEGLSDLAPLNGVNLWAMFNQYQPKISVYPFLIPLSGK